MKNQQNFQKAPQVNTEFQEHSMVHQNQLISFQSSMLEQERIPQKGFVIALGLLECSIIIIHGLFADYSQLEGLKQNKSYAQFQDINVMIVVGFGFLMTVLRHYQFSALGSTFLIAAISFQLHPITLSLFECIYHRESYVIEYTVEILYTSSFCAGAILISLGGLLGKLTKLQLLVLIILETFIYSLNELFQIVMKVADIGGSMVIHAFGAFFGLTVCYLLKSRAQLKNPSMSANYFSDITSFLGTVFLWMYWPSFNSAFAEVGSTRQTRAIINTVFSLSGSVITSFLFSFYLRNELRKGEKMQLFMVDIQNATLAGGVAMGTCADMNLNPVIAILIGCFAGVISTLGFAKLQGYLEEKINLHDTCGILNLHGIPSVYGALVGVLASGLAKPQHYGGLQLMGEVFPEYLTVERWHGGEQAIQQIWFLIITLLMAIGGGFAAGFILRSFWEPSQTLFKDQSDWEIPHIKFEEREKPDISANQSHDARSIEK